MSVRPSSSSTYPANTSTTAAISGSVDYAPFATSILASSAAILAFALITALASHSMIDLLARRLVYRRAFAKWRKRHFRADRLDTLPNSAFGLSSERLSALVANQLRLEDPLQLEGPLQLTAGGFSLAALDQAVDEFQADLIDSDRYLRYIMSTVVPMGLFILLLSEGSVHRGNLYLLLGSGVCVTLLAAWIQGLRLRAFQSQ